MGTESEDQSLQLKKKKGRAPSSAPTGSQHPGPMSSQLIGDGPYEGRSTGLQMRNDDFGEHRDLKLLHSFSLETQPQQSTTQATYVS